MSISSTSPTDSARSTSSAGAGADALALATELFPLHRSLVGTAYHESLAIIARRIPIEIERIPSGTRVHDWIVPNAWDPRAAWIETLDGRRLVDFDDCGIHLSQYSIGFDGVVSHDELMQHIATLPDRPDAIPYNYLYYRRDWQFNVRHRDLERFDAPAYRVHIDVDERPGDLEIATMSLPGTSGRELLVTTYLCHPSLANDNLSGVVTAVELFRRLAARWATRPRDLGVRLVIVPETIGAIAWMAQHPELRDAIDGALVVYDCGDRAPITYKRSWFEDAWIDRLVDHCLRHGVPDARRQGWSASGSDERQFNAPGVRLPAGAFMRSPAGSYPQYHTSLDTLDMLDAAALDGSIQTLAAIVEAAEMDERITMTTVGEPCFSRHEISYPTWHGDRGAADALLVKSLLYELDGRTGLLEVADRLGAPIERVFQLASAFVEAGIAQRLPRAARRSTPVAIGAAADAVAASSASASASASSAAASVHAAGLDVGLDADLAAGPADPPTSDRATHAIEPRLGFPVAAPTERSA